MLILSRKKGESLYIGDNIQVQVIEIKGAQVRLAFDAPDDVRIQRLRSDPDGKGEEAQEA